MPLLSFIVPVRNDAARLRRCLETMRSKVPSEVIVADNGSTDGSADVARDAGARVLCIPGKPVSSLRNEAAATAKGDLLAFVDADHELGAEWVDAAVALFRDHPTLAAAGAPYHAPSDGTWVQRMYDKLRRRRPGTNPVDWLPSGNLVVRRQSFQAIGGFDTSLETCEDVDLCQRLVASGGLIVECDGLMSIHRGDPRTLRALFLGELWRGRDNLRVTLRGPFSFGSLPSLLLPATLLVAGPAILIGAAWPAGRPVAAIGLALAACVVTARAATLLRRVGPEERTGRTVIEAFIVGGVYDTARALALVARPSHDLRRRG